MTGAGGASMAAIAGDLACVESMAALKDLFGQMGSPHLDCRQDGAKLDASVRAGYLFNTTIAGIEEADVCLLVGTNPRWEAALINARLRKRFLRGGFRVFSIGPRLDLTFPAETLGAGPETLEAIAAGGHPFVETLTSAKRPMIVVGQGALARRDGAAILAAAGRIAVTCRMVRDGWNGFNVLHTAAARVGGLDLGFVPGDGGLDVGGILDGASSGKTRFVYLLGADEIDLRRLGAAFVVYQGHHGDAGANRADVILPGATYTEKPATYVNTEGRVQQTKRVVFPPGEAREDWAIVRALAEAVGVRLPYDSLAELRQGIEKAHPHLGVRGVAPKAAWGSFGTEGRMEQAPFRSPVDDFYMTNAICRASETMAACSTLYVGAGAGKTGTHG
jgi:NADH-quinone oxidoreductase subunit G